MAFLNGLRIYPPGTPIAADLKKAPFIKKVLLLGNKVDNESDERITAYFWSFANCRCPRSPSRSWPGYNLSEFLGKIYEMAAVIRVYTKSPGKEPDLTSPSVLPEDSTLEEACRQKSIRIS